MKLAVFSFLILAIVFSVICLVFLFMGYPMSEEEKKKRQEKKKKASAGTTQQKNAEVQSDEPYRMDTNGKDEERTETATVVASDEENVKPQDIASDEDNNTQQDTVSNEENVAQRDTASDEEDVIDVDEDDRIIAIMTGRRLRK